MEMGMRMGGTRAGVMVSGVAGSRSEEIDDASLGRLVAAAVEQQSRDEGRVVVAASAAAAAVSQSVTHCQLRSCLVVVHLRWTTTRLVGTTDSSTSSLALARLGYGRCGSDFSRPQNRLPQFPSVAPGTY